MIRLINTTTRLPVNRMLETAFFRIADPVFIDAVEKRSHAAHVDVQFVNREDLDLELKIWKDIEEGKSEQDERDVAKTVITDMDLLGVYFPHHRDHHRPIIKVSPEKVMKECVSLKKKPENYPPLDVLYPTILHAVVIHELAHSLMTPAATSNKCLVPWMWLADWKNGRGQYNFSRFRCDYSHNSAIPIQLRRLRRFIEESLANAFVLKQCFKTVELAALRKFVDSQPPEYKAGLQWKSDIKNLLDTGEAWSRFNEEWIKCRWALIYSEIGGTRSPVPMEVLIEDLKAGKNISSFNFGGKFEGYLRSRLPEWRAKAHKDNDWHEVLNGMFGVVNTLQRPRPPNRPKTQLNDFEGAPTSIGHNFYYGNNGLTSLKGVPPNIAGDFDCSYNQLHSLQGAPTCVGGNFDCHGNKLTSLHDIHKLIKQINGTFWADENPIKSHVLGLLYIKGCKRVELYNKKVEGILNRHLPNTKGHSGLIKCQSELLDEGFAEYAQL